LGLFHVALDDTQVCGYYVPKGTAILTNLQSVNMSTDHWQDPKAFRPERFLDESGQIVGRENILPFSLGKRSCIGISLVRQQLFLFTTLVVRNFLLLPPFGQEKINPTEILLLTMRPSPFEIRMVPIVKI